MSKNLMTEICKNLNVELGEEFKVDIYGDRIFRIIKSGLWEKKIDDDDHCDIWEEQLVVLRELLIGDVEIVKLPWKPKFGEKYWTFDGATICSCVVWGIMDTEWNGWPCDYAALDKGWVYRSEEDAKAALRSMAKVVGVRYEL